MFEDEGERGPDVLAYFEAPLRRPLFVVVPFVLLTAGAIGLSYTYRKLYSSSTLILVESERVPDSFVERVATDTAARQLVTLKQQILSRTRLERVIEEVDPYPELKGQATLTEMVELIRGQIMINTKSNDAFAIEYVHTDPVKARDVANRLASLFIEEAAESRTKQVQEATEFIATQVSEARAKLEEQEASLRRFKERNLGHLPEQTSANLATQQRLQTEKQAREDSLRSALDRLSLLENSAGGAVGIVSLAEPGAELNKLKAQLAALRVRYTEEHPDVRQLVARIDRLEGRVVEPAPSSPAPTQDLAVEKARLEVETLRTRIQELEERIATIQARVELAPRTEQELQTLTRDYQKHRENYMTLLQKQMQAEQAAQLEERWRGHQFRILDPAFLPTRAFFPERRLFALVGALIGLLLGVGLSIAAEALDPSIKSVHDLQALMALPVLATVPHVGTARRRKSRASVGANAPQG